MTLRTRLLALLAVPLALGGCGIVPTDPGGVCRIAEAAGYPCPGFVATALNAATLAGLDLTGTRGASLADDPAVVAADARGALPLAFTLDLDVSNPDEAPLDLQQLAWTLSIDGEEAARGVSTEARTIPPGGSATVPLQVEADLRATFGDRSRTDLVGLAEALADGGGRPGTLRIAVVPTVRTAGGGTYVYPEPFLVDYPAPRD